MSENAPSRKIVKFGPWDLLTTKRISTVYYTQISATLHYFPFKISQKCPNELAFFAKGISPIWRGNTWSPEDPETHPDLVILAASCAAAAAPKLCPKRFTEDGGLGEPKGSEIWFKRFGTKPLKTYRNGNNKTK